MKRIIFITGFYGTGKTEVSLNLALRLHVDYLIDLDIINPYFRSREMKDKLDEHINIISSDLEKDQYSDLPYLSKKIFLPFHQKDLLAIYDLGGNDLGAKLIRQFDREDLNDSELLMVINIYRSETMTADHIISFIKAIEKESKKQVTGLINNTNLLGKTTVEDLVEGERIIHHVSSELKIPIVYTCVEESLDINGYSFMGETLRLKRFFKKAWLK